MSATIEKRLNLAWLRHCVRVALRRVDGTADRELAVIAAYDRLVAAEPHRQWPA